MLEEMHNHTEALIQAHLINCNLNGLENEMGDDLHIIISRTSMATMLCNTSWTMASTKTSPKLVGFLHYNFASVLV